MAKVNILFNSLINKAMHKPTLADGTVLYPHIDNYQGKGEVDLGKAQADPVFIVKSQQTFNSPTNIRRVFITYKGVWVHYYTPYKTGKGESGYTTHKNYELPANCDCSDLKEVVGKIINRPAIQQEYMNEKTYNKDAVAPNEYTIKGNVFGALSNSYACNNIEEIYFDWSVFTAEEVIPLLQNTNFRLNNLSALAGGQAGQLIKDNGTFVQLFQRFNANGNVKGVFKRFPRLRMIGFISNLEAIMQQEGAVKNHTAMLKETESSSKTWCEVNSDLIKASGSWIALNQLDRPALNKEFRVKSEQYKFDKEIFRNFVTSYQKKIGDIERIQRYGAKGEQGKMEGSENVKLTDSDRLINDLFGNLPEEEVQKILRISFTGLRVSEKKKFLVDLSKNNREKVADILKFDLSKL